MADPNNPYETDRSGAERAMSALRSNRTRGFKEGIAPERILVRAATEESEEMVHLSANMKPNPMLPPSFQRPIPTKPEVYGSYRHPNHPSNYPVSAGQHFQSTGPCNSVQSVITSSFSIEDSSFAHERMFSQTERRTDASNQKFLRTNSDPYDQRELPPEAVAETPFNDHQDNDAFFRSAFSSLSRTFSSGSDCHTSPMKRNYFHHVQSQNLNLTHIPADFLPPKRNKIEARPRDEVTLKPRYPTVQSHGSWVQAEQSWESREDEATIDHVSPINDFKAASPQQGWYRQSGSSTSGDRPMIHRPTARLPIVNNLPPQYGPPQSCESTQPFWGEHNAEGWCGPYPTQEPRQFWSSPPSWQQHRDDAESTRYGAEYRDGSLNFQESCDAYDSPPPKGQNLLSNRAEIFRSPYATAGDNHSFGEKTKLATEALSFSESQRDAPKGGEPPLLLALPQDRVSLSETLCVVRENIEVFLATQSDVDAPAPGRKHSVVVGQVGLRCIHCRHTTRASDRVKRAVCYPSSIKRIYRTVIDMKLDHLSQCKFVPKVLTDRLNELKAVHTRSTGTTMQYFIKAAQMLGMEDGPSGVSLNLSKMKKVSGPFIVKSGAAASAKELPPLASRSESFSGDTPSSSLGMCAPQRHDSMVSTCSFDSTMASEPLDESGNYYDGKVPLALPEDKTALSPLRCFLREQVCAFSATEEDIAVRAPTTFSITLGQVGIGCIYCVNQPPKYRSNRAVCFPFSIGRIYQSVADIQRFHLGECKMLPPAVKESFNSLQSASSKGSKGLATRQYWMVSARKLGLVDTKYGIRFCRDPSVPHQSKAFSLDILAQAAFSVTTTNKKLVVPEDRKSIAEFLYVVMEQLQPCRFTEADRNKRRVRDVGCIGVECKHCAGQVDSRKFFWSSVSAVESNFVSVHTHMLECRLIPQELKERLIELKKLRKEQTAQLMTGSQKAFFRRVWERLHSEEIISQATTTDSIEEATSEEGLILNHSNAIPSGDNISENCTNDLLVPQPSLRPTSTTNKPEQEPPTNLFSTRNDGGCDDSVSYSVTEMIETMQV